MMENIGTRLLNVGLYLVFPHVFQTEKSIN